MDEAEYCDRIGLVYQGHMIAEGSPDELKDAARGADRPDPTLEDAFIELVEQYDRRVQNVRQLRPNPGAPGGGAWRGLCRKELMQIVRDPSSYLIAGLMPLLLLFIFGYGVSLDLRQVPVAVVVENPTPEANSLLLSFRNSRYFTVVQAADRRQSEADLLAGRVKGVIVLADDFSDRLGRGDSAPVQILVDGSDPNTAGLVLNYAQGVWGNWLVQEIVRPGRPGSPRPAAIADPARAAVLVQSRGPQPEFSGSRLGGHHHDADRHAAHARWSSRGSGSAARSKP